MLQAGRLVYRKCQACHSLEAGKNTLGPSLAGIFGKKAGEVPELQLFARAEGLEHRVGRGGARCVSARSAEGGAGKQDAVSRPEDRERAQGRDRLSRGESASGSPQVAQRPPAPASPPAAAPQAQSAASAAPAQPPAQPARPSVSYIPDVRYTLRSGIAEGRMVFIGVGGTIDGQVNPLLSAAEGQVVQITLINGEGAEHDIVFPEQDAKSPRITGRGASTSVVFRATRAGDFTYICSVPGHQLAGMEGQFVVTPRPPAQVVVEADISQKSTDVPPPIGNRPPQTVRVDLSPSSSKAVSPKARPSATGPSTARCRDPCCACASAIRSTFTSRIPPTAA